jgi:hypothetical protein
MMLSDIIPPFLIGLGTPDRDAQPVRAVGQILDAERDQLAAAERAGKAQGEQRAVARAEHRVAGNVLQHLGEHVGGAGDLLGLGRADRVADAAQHRLDALLVGGGLEPGKLVPMRDRRC